METQRQWSDLAIQRTTPCLLGLFSLVTLFAHQHRGQRSEGIRQSTWYHKEHPTFSDALALVRRQLWAQNVFSMSNLGVETIKVPRVLVESMTDALCYAA